MSEKFIVSDFIICRTKIVFYYFIIRKLDYGCNTHYYFRCCIGPDDFFDITRFYLILYDKSNL